MTGKPGQSAFHAPKKVASTQVTALLPLHAATFTPDCPCVASKPCHSVEISKRNL
jgi:hypothetical protein